MVFESGFAGLVNLFQQYGFMDFLLPFILIFTLVFAVTAKMPLFKDNKNFRVIMALVLALLFVMPHFTGFRPLGYDPVEVLFNSLPSISLLAVAIVMMLMLIGVFGSEGLSDKARPFILIVTLGFVGYIFGASLEMWTGPYNIWTWWTTELTEILIILAIFGAIVAFITVMMTTIRIALKISLDTLEI